MSRDKLLGILVRFGCYEPHEPQPSSEVKPKAQPQAGQQDQVTPLSPSLPQPQLLPEPKVYVYEDTPKTVLVVEDNKINRVSSRSTIMDY